MEFDFDFNLDFLLPESYRFIIAFRVYTEFNSGSIDGKSWCHLESKMVLASMGHSESDPEFHNSYYYEIRVLKLIGLEEHEGVDAPIYSNFSWGPPNWQSVSDGEKEESEGILASRTEEPFLLATKVTPSCLQIYIWTPYPANSGFYKLTPNCSLVFCHMTALYIPDYLGKQTWSKHSLYFPFLSFPLFSLFRLLGVSLISPTPASPEPPSIPELSTT